MTPHKPVRRGRIASRLNLHCSNELNCRFSAMLACFVGFGAGFAKGQGEVILRSPPEDRDSPFLPKDFIRCKSVLFSHGILTSRR